MTSLFEAPVATAAHGASRVRHRVVAFGILLALFQNYSGKAGGPLLIGLEEPEMALHPAATGILLASLREAMLFRRLNLGTALRRPNILDWRGG